MIWVIYSSLLLSLRKHFPSEKALKPYSLLAISCAPFRFSSLDYYLLQTTHGMMIFSVQVVIAILSVLVKLGLTTYPFYPLSPSGKDIVKCRFELDESLKVVKSWNDVCKFLWYFRQTGWILSNSIDLLLYKWSHFTNYDFTIDCKKCSTRNNDKTACCTRAMHKTFCAKLGV